MVVATVAVEAVQLPVAADEVPGWPAVQLPVAAVVAVQLPAASSSFQALPAGTVPTPERAHAVQVVINPLPMAPLFTPAPPRTFEVVVRLQWCPWARTNYQRPYTLR